MKKIETKRIRIGNQDLPFRFSVSCYMYYSEMFNNEITNIKTTRDMVNLGYCGYLAAQEFIGDETHITEREFKNLLDTYPDSFEEIISIMKEQIFTKKK